MDLNEYVEQLNSVRGLIEKKGYKQYNEEQSLRQQVLEFQMRRMMNEAIINVNKMIIEKELADKKKELESTTSLETPKERKKSKSKKSKKNKKEKDSLKLKPSITRKRISKMSLHQRVLLKAALKMEYHGEDFYMDLDDFY